MARTELQRTLSYVSIMNAGILILDLNKARTIAVVIDRAEPIPPNDILKMFLKEPVE